MDYAVDDFDALAWETHAAFHIILPPVDRTPYFLTEFLGIGKQGGFSFPAFERIVIGVGDFGHHCVAGGEIEDHDVAGLHSAASFQAVILHGGGVQIAFAQPEGEFVVDQGEIYRCHRHAGTVDRLVHEKVVARQEGFLQRGGGNLIVLPYEGKDEIDKHQGIDDSVHP